MRRDITLTTRHKGHNLTIKSNFCSPNVRHAFVLSFVSSSFLLAFGCTSWFAVAIVFGHDKFQLVSSPVTAIAATVAILVDLQSDVSLKPTLCQTLPCNLAASVNLLQ